MRRRNIIRYWAALIATASLAACSQAYNDPTPEIPAGERMVLKLTVPGGNLKTRAVAAEEGENNINDMTLLFFEPTTNGTGKYLGYYRVPGEEIPEEDEMYGDEKNVFDLNIDFREIQGLNVSDAYSILVFANMDRTYFTDIDTDLDVFTSDISRLTQNEVSRYMIMEVSGVGTTVTDQDDNSNALYPSHLPMSAVCQKQENVELVECKLTRAVVRYDVVNKASGYLLMSASIWNAYPYGMVWDNVNTDYSFKNLKRYYGLKSDQNGFDAIYGGLYSFENVWTNPDPIDEKTTCLILGMAPQGDPTDITYYRVNISPSETGQYLMRNNVYQVTVSSVKSAGAGTEYDAYTSGDMLLDTSINSWDRDEDGLIMRDGDNLMAVPTRKARFGPEAEDRQYYVYTLGTGTLEMYKLEMPEGMDAWLGGNGNDLFIRVSAYAFDQRKGSIELRFAGMRATIEIIQSGQTDKYLTLSHTQFESWPAGSINANMASDNPVTVESSGPWTAKIYNGNFSFRYNQTEDTRTGEDGDQITAIYNTSVNSDQNERTSFVLVSLNDDPQNYRNVIVLTQMGTGSFAISPDNSQIRFQANGDLVQVMGNTNLFEVRVSSQTDTWNVYMDPSGEHSHLFEIREHDGSTMPVGKTFTGDGKFIVVSPANNYSGTVRANVIVKHNQVNTKIIEAHKLSYDLKLSDNSIDDISKAGETSEAVKVTSTDGNATWSAVITSNLDPARYPGMQPYIVMDGQESISVSGKAMGTTFQVKMPPILQWLDGIIPIATVTVKLDGSSLSETLIVRQNPVTYSTIEARTVGETAYFNWNSKDIRAQAWVSALTNPSNFGPSGTVYTTGFDLSSASSSGTVPDNKFRFINSTNSDITGTVNLSNWQAFYTNNRNVVYVISPWSNQSIFRALGLNDSYNAVATNRVSAATYRMIYKGNAQAMQTEIWKYIFEDGPFGPVNPDNVNLRPGDDTYALLNQWPATFIPLIMNPTSASNTTPNPSYCAMGIDPVNRIIWMDHEMFSTYAYGSTNFDNADKMNFMLNIMAYMVNVANYGEPFLKRFENDRSK